MRKLISIIIPAYNEEDCVDELARRLRALFNLMSQYDFEVLLVENGSSDSTWQRILQIRDQDKRFKLIRLARNFGMDGGLTAGLQLASGDAAVLMTADLQDPPELIEEFIRKWEEGYQNVYMVVAQRSGTGLLRRVNSLLFYSIVSKLSNIQIPRNASDFRLVDRQVYQTVLRMNERNRFMRGMFAWVGFRSIGIEAVRPIRYAGVSKAQSRVVFELATKGILANSYIPLRSITVVGTAISLLSILSILPLFIFWIVAGVPFAGFGSIISIILLFFGILTLMIGIVAEYVAMIYEEVKARPNFVIETLLGFESQPH